MAEAKAAGWLRPHLSLPRVVVLEVQPSGGGEAMRVEPPGMGSVPFSVETPESCLPLPPFPFRHHRVRARGEGDHLHTKKSALAEPRFVSTLILDFEFLPL